MEGEALAVADSLNKARFFVLDCSDLISAIDHKPLLKVFSDQSLEEISNARVEKTLRYKFHKVHIPGVRHRAADAVSRHCTGPTNPDMMLLPDDIAASDASAIYAIPVQPLWTLLPKLHLLQRASSILHYH